MNVPKQAESEAIDKATSGARAAAARARESLLAELRLKAFADTAKSLHDSFQPGAVTVVDSSQDRAVAFATWVWAGEATGGFYEQAAVRLCVRYSGVVGPDDRVDVADTDCPTGLPTYVNGVQVVQNVTLGK